jgi:hypothetical protein
MGHIDRNAIFFGEAKIDHVRYHKLSGQIFHIRKTIETDSKTDWYYSNVYYHFSGKMVTHYLERTSMTAEGKEGEELILDNR